VGRLSERDQGRAREVVDAISSLDDAAPGVLPVLLPALAELTGVSVVGAYSVHVDAHGVGRCTGLFRGFDERSDEVLQRLDAFVQSATRSGGRALPYDVTNPLPSQRSRAIGLPWASWFQGGWEGAKGRVRRDLRRLGMEPDEVDDAAAAAVAVHRDVIRNLSVERCGQVRALVCEGSSLLSWVGLFPEGDPTERHRLLLAQLIRPLQQRLTLERRLGEAVFSHSAMVAALDTLTTAAFVVDDHGRPHHANALGRAALEQDRVEATERLAAAVRAPDDPAFSVSRLRGPGLAPFFLVTARAAARDPAQAVRAAGKDWPLSKREAKVLEHLACGTSNGAIAGALGCAERTVELHVSSILRKTGLGSRARLIAELWRRYA
jgi:DNA-binding CsgD family transcriptional regulator